MLTINFDLIMQKGSRVVQMIIAHKMRAKNKVALAVELSICIFKKNHSGSNQKWIRCSAKLIILFSRTYLMNKIDNARAIYEIKHILIQFQNKHLTIS